MLTQATSGASSIAFSYSYNKNGYITGEKRTEDGKTTTSSYTYDPLGEIASFLQSTGYGETYAYDKAGNMTNKVITPIHAEGEEAEAITLKMKYNKGNQLTSMANGRDTVSYSYDKNGSMVQKVLSSKQYGKLKDTYAYNALDQLSSYIGYDGYQQTFTYDANGMRLTKTEAGNGERSTLEELLRGDIAGLPEIITPTETQTNDDITTVPSELEWATTEYLYDITQEYYQVITETTSGKSGSTTTAYAYGLERNAAYTESETSRYVYDGRGSVAQTITAPVAGNSVTAALPDVKVTARSFAYTAFGEQMGTQKVGGFGYNAEAFDAAIGMINLRARQYRPAINRFSQNDSHHGYITQVLTINRYAYCQNEPIMHSDPSGKIAGIIPFVQNKAPFIVPIIASTFNYNSIAAKLQEAFDKKQEETRQKVALVKFGAALLWESAKAGLESLALSTRNAVNAWGAANRERLLNDPEYCRIQEDGPQPGVAPDAEPNATPAPSSTTPDTSSSSGYDPDKQDKDKKGDIQKISDNKRANKIAKELGFDGAEAFKADFVGKSNISRYNMVYGKKTGEIFLQLVKNPSQLIATGFFVP